MDFAFYKSTEFLNRRNFFLTFRLRISRFLSIGLLRRKFRVHLFWYQTFRIYGFKFFIKCFWRREFCYLNALGSTVTNVALCVAISALDLNVPHIIQHNYIITNVYVYFSLFSEHKVLHRLYSRDFKKSIYVFFLSLHGT